MNLESLGAKGAARASLADVHAQLEGCADPAVDCEVSDPATGEVLAIAEACWPEGLQPGQGDPVILELDPAEADLSRIEEIGYEVFTSIESLGVNNCLSQCREFVISLI
jgi:hypothetical protein